MGAEWLATKDSIHHDTDLNNCNTACGNTTQLSDGWRVVGLDSIEGGQARDDLRANIAERQQRNQQNAAPPIEPVAMAIRDRDAEEESASVAKSPPAREMAEEHKRLMSIVRVHAAVAEHTFFQHEVEESGQAKQDPKRASASVSRQCGEHATAHDRAERPPHDSNVELEIATEQSEQDLLRVLRDRPVDICEIAVDSFGVKASCSS